MRTCAAIGLAVTVQCHVYHYLKVGASVYSVTQGIQQVTLGKILCKIEGAGELNSLTVAALWLVVNSALEKAL